MRLAQEQPRRPAHGNRKEGGLQDWIVLGLLKANAKPGESDDDEPNHLSLTPGRLPLVLPLPLREARNFK
jgi:hypothetical protein